MVSVGVTGTVRWVMMSPRSRSASIQCAVMPTWLSPLISAQFSGEKPAYFGSSESWVLTVPRVGAEKTSGLIHVRQLQATPISAPDSSIAVTSSSSTAFSR